MAIASIDTLGKLRVSHVKASATDQSIDLVLSSILGYDGPRACFANSLRNKLNIRLDERRIEVIGEQDALTAHRVVRRKLCLERGIWYLPVQVTERDLLGTFEHAGPVD